MKKFYPLNKNLFTRLLMIMSFALLNFIGTAQVLNPSFELNPIVPLPGPLTAFATYTAGAIPQMTNWTSTSITDVINLHHSTHWAMGSSNLNYHVDLNQTGQITSSGILLAGGPGVSNNISFDVSIHAVMAAAGFATAQVEISGPPGTPIFVSGFGMTKTTAMNIPQGWGLPTITVPFPVPTTGIYTVRFTGMSSTYALGGILIDNVIIPCPTVSISGPTSVCAGNPVTLNALPNLSPVYDYTWTPGGASTPSISPIIFNTTTYSVTMNDPISGCTSTATHTVTVIPPITPTFSFNTTYCANSPIPPLPTTSNNGITGTWSPALSNTVSQTYTFTPNPGQCALSYVVAITIDYCCYNVDFCYTVENKTLRFTSVTPSANVAPCTYNYRWIWGDGTTSATFSTATLARAATKTYASESNYTVCLEVRRVCSGVVTCCKSICKEIKMIPNCGAAVINAELGLSLRSTATGTIVTPIITSPDFRALLGTQLTISYGFPGLPNYNVNTGLNTFNVTLARRTYTIPGVYEYCVTLRYMNPLGDSCVDRKCKTIVIEPWCATQANFRLASCAQSNTFTFTPIGNTTSTNVSWDFGDGTTGVSIGNTPITKTYASSGLYQVCMRVLQGKCYSSACYFVNVTPFVETNCLPSSLRISRDEDNGVNINDIPLNEILIPTEEGKNNVSTMVYPNPASESVNVILNAPKESEVKIVLRNMEGRLLFSTTKLIGRENSKETIDISTLSNGLYIISIEAEGQLNTHRFVVNK